MSITNCQIAYYSLNGNADDSSGNRHHGTLHGPIPAMDRFERKNRAIEFVKNEDLIELPHQIADNLSDFSLSFWVKTQKKGCIISGANNLNHNEIVVGINSEGYLSITLKQRFVMQSNKPIIDNCWHHIVITRDGSDNEVTIYVDNRVAGQGDMAEGKLVVADSGLWLGNDQDSIGSGWEPDAQFIGSLDELRFYKRILCEREMNKLFIFKKE
ncbi:MAG: LamG domain-containing protein [Candidatus Cloacimonetes bacterium]|nr:LamG domain-containing protein [Candidatus Cloacimonadota bacterium]